MLYFIITQLLSLLLDCLLNRTRSDRQKDLEILLLRPQLLILQRPQSSAPRLSRWEKLGLAILAAQFVNLGRGGKSKLAEVLRLFKPDTVLGWHRDLVRRKSTFARPRTVGRPATDPEVLALLLRLAQENPTWGYGKPQGELLKLGHTLGRSIIRDLLKRQQVPPAPEWAKQNSSWSTFLNHYREQILACDFFTVETAWLKTIYVFFFIEVGSRRVHFAGCTAHPTAEWVTQQARQLIWNLQDAQKSMCFLIRDRDAQFTSSFDTVFGVEGVEIVRTPYRAPKANAFAERWSRSARAEVLDRVLILSEAHWRQVISEYIAYYNQRRPHQGIEQRCPKPIDRQRADPVQCRDVVGGVIHDYYQDAA